jgi:calcineurin-like phosphoesterase family protein
MDQELIKRWNSVVGSCDLVYHLGDYAFSHNKEYLHTLRARLNGKIILIAGNHDRDKALKESRIDTIYGHTKSAGIKTYPMVRIDLAGQQIILCHYAMRVWDKSHWGIWHLYGHSHGSLPDDPRSLSYDVGVDKNNFTPLLFEEVKEIMSKKTFKPVDHHGEKRGE